MKEFAPGIPENRKIHTIDIVPGITRMVIQEHNAKRAGKHFDLRIRSGDLAHSWALRKLPEEVGDKVLAVQQPTHTSGYMGFAGEIPEGYGAGTVNMHTDTAIDVMKSSPGLITYVTPEKKEYALIKTSDKSWLLQRLPDREGTVASKPDYGEIKLHKLKADDVQKVWQPKLDGAHTIVELGKKNKIYSYRKSKITGKTIDHTHQLPKIRDIETPKEWEGTVLRTEVVARHKGKVLAAHDVGGLLNSGIIKSRVKQESEDKRLFPVAFDVIKYKGKDVSELPYEEKIPILETVSKEFPEIKVPEMAFSAEQKRNLLDRIQSGNHPDTEEGIVEWNLKGTQARKAKIRPEFDVWVRKISPGLRGYDYSTTEKGPIVGRVGTGFKEEVTEDMWENPERYIGRVARVNAQQQFESGALRAPAHVSMHVEKGLEKSSGIFINNIRKTATEDVPSKASGDQILWRQWKDNPTPETLTPLMGAIKPIINKELGRWSQSGIHPAVLDAQANELAYKALHTYDPSKAQLNTHIVNSLHKMSRVVTQKQNIVRTPEEKIYGYRRYLKEVNDLQEELGRAPTDLEIKEKLGETGKLSKFRPTTEHFYGHPEATAPVMQELTTDAIGMAILYDQLSDRQKFIFEHTHGYKGAPVLSNKEIARQLGISPPAVTKHKNVIEKKYRNYNLSIQRVLK